MSTNHTGVQVPGRVVPPTGVTVGIVNVGVSGVLEGSTAVLVVVDGQPGVTVPVGVGAGVSVVVVAVGVVVSVMVGAGVGVVDDRPEVSVVVIEGVRHSYVEQNSSRR